MFGGGSGYVHPFLSVEELYTDNLFNLPEGEEDDEFITVISPGIWLSFPAGSRQPLQVTTLNSAPGGLAVTRFPLENRRRLQGYALYRADINEHKNYSEEDNVYQRAEGLLNYRFRGGLSLEFVDIYEISQDPYSTGTSRQLDKFTSNLAQFLIDYRFSPKMRVRADLTRYSLDYDADRNRFRERDDNALALYYFHRILPKTSLLLEFDTVEIEYQENILFDSREESVFAGLFWESSEKAQALAKFGHSWRDTDGEEKCIEYFIGEIRLDYRFTPKTSTSLAFTRQAEETDIVGTSNILTHRAQISYRQQLATRWSGTVDLYGYKDDYRAVDGESLDREDDYLGARLALSYLFRRWLNFGFGYNVIERDSNTPGFDYTNNTFFLSATAAL